MHSTLLVDIGLCIVAATVLAYGARFARQPLLLAYIAAGILIGPIGFGYIHETQSIQMLAEFGLAFLLFIVGLEIDVRKLIESGKVAVATTFVQVAGCLALAWGAALLLGFAGLPALYLGMAAAFSSTMIVVKNLADRSELDTLPGRVTLGILLVQDVFAVLVLAIQPNLGGAGTGDASLLASIAWSMGRGLALVGGTLAVGRFVLPVVLRSVAKSPEILMTSAVSWCFLICWIAIKAGFSSAAGALIAGIGMSSLPYTIEIVAKVRSLRDFFVTLFFVSLGMLLPIPTLRLLFVALVLSAVVVVGRFVTIPVALRVLGFDNRVGLVSAIHLSQISEFALVIVLIGVSDAYRHISSEITSLVVMVLVITATVSTYMVQFSHSVVRTLVRWIRATPLKDPHSEEGRSALRHEAPLVLVGCFRVGASVIRELMDSGREFKVIDFNPRTQRDLLRIGVPCIYGDISHPDTLEHAGVESAEVLVSPISDDFLRGTSNRKLLDILRRLNPAAKVVVTADSIPEALELYGAGADYVMVPRVLAAERLLEVLRRADEGDLAALRAREIDALKTRQEIDL